MAWSSVRNLGDVPITGRSHHAAACLGSKIFIFGGMGPHQYADVEVKSLELGKKNYSCKL